MIVRPVARAVSRAVSRPVTGYVYDVTAPVVTIADVNTIDLRPSLGGTVDDPTASVQVTVLGLVYQCVNNGNGAWSLAENVLPPLPFGNTTAHVQATDPLGNASTADGTVYVFDPSLLFAGGAPGVWLDPNDLSVQFQDSSGTTAAAAGHPLGLTLDKSRGLSLGPELVNNGNFSSGSSSWAARQNTSLSVVNGRLRVTAIAAGSFGVDGTLSSTPASGTVLRFSATVINSAGADLYARAGNATALVHNTSFSRLSVGSGVNSIAFSITTGTPGAYFEIDDVSARVILGSHAYQATAGNKASLRINSTTGYYYYEPDGVDDFMQTAAINFASTSKVFLIAGVKKISDAATGVVVELGSTLGNTEFSLFAPAGNGANSFRWQPQAGAVNQIEVGNSFPAPTSAVLACVVDKSANYGLMHISDTQVNPPAGFSVSGAFSNNPLYLFRRAGTSLPSSAHLYGLIIVGAGISLINYILAKQWMARRVGVTLQ